MKELFTYVKDGNNDELKALLEKTPTLAHQKNE